MSALKFGNQNLSNAYNSRAIFIADGTDEIRWWVKSIVLPGLDMEPEPLDLQFDIVKLAGNKRIFSEFSLNVFVDEDYLVLKEAFTWLNDRIPGDNYKKTKRDGRILIMNNTFTSVVYTYILHGLSIMGVAGGEFLNSGTEERTVDLSFHYDSFTAL